MWSIYPRIHTHHLECTQHTHAHACSILSFITMVFKVNAFNAQLLSATEVFVDIARKDFKWMEVESSSAILYNIVLCNNSCVHSLIYMMWSVRNPRVIILCHVSNNNAIQHSDALLAIHNHCGFNIIQTINISLYVRWLLVICRKKFSHSFDVQ